MVLKSLHFSKEKNIDAYNFPIGSDFPADFSESEYGEDSIISRESTLSPTSISELEDSDIHTTTQIYSSKLEDKAEWEDEVVRCKPEKWNEYPESEGFEVCITPLPQSASDEDDKASTPEPRILSPAHQFYREFSDDQKDDEPLEANSPELQTFSPLHQSSPESDDDLKDDEPLEETSSEPQLLSLVHQYYSESNDDLKDDESLVANSPEPQPFSPVHQSSPESDDGLKDDEPLEANSPEPRPFSRVQKPNPESDNDQKDDVLLEAESPQPRQFLPANHFYSDFNDYQWDNESPGADSPEPRRLFPVHRFQSTLYDPKPPQMEILCPEPIWKYPTHKVILEPELFEDCFVDMSEVIFINEEAISPEPSILGTPSPEPQTPSPVRCHTPNPEFGDQASLEAHSPKPQLFVPVHQSHPGFYEPQPILELDHEGLESLEIWNLYH